MLAPSSNPLHTAMDRIVRPASPLAVPPPARTAGLDLVQRSFLMMASRLSIGVRAFGMYAKATNPQRPSRSVSHSYLFPRSCRNGSRGRPAATLLRGSVIDVTHADRRPAMAALEGLENGSGAQRSNAALIARPIGCFRIGCRCPACVGSRNGGRTMRRSPEAETQPTSARPVSPWSPAGGSQHARRRQTGHGWWRSAHPRRGLRGARRSRLLKSVQRKVLRQNFAMQGLAPPQPGSSLTVELLLSAGSGRGGNRTPPGRSGTSGYRARTGPGEL